MTAAEKQELKVAVIIVALMVLLWWLWPPRRAEAAEVVTFRPLAQQENARYRLTLYRVGLSCFVLAEGKGIASEWNGRTATYPALVEVDCP